LGDVDDDEVGVFVVEGELGVEEVGMGGFGAVGAGEGFPDGPDAVDVGVEAVEGGVAGGDGEVAHVVVGSGGGWGVGVAEPEMDGAVGVVLEGAGAGGAGVAEAVGQAEEEVGGGGAGDELRVHELVVLGAEFRGGFSRAPAGGVEVDCERGLGAVVAVLVPEGGRFVARVEVGQDVGVGRLGRLVVPVPERERERVVAQQLRQNALVEVDEHAVPGQEQPPAVNLQRPCLVRVVQSVVAVQAVQVHLVAPRARVRVRELALQPHPALQLRNVLLVQQMRRPPHPHRQRRIVSELPHRPPRVRPRHATPLLAVAILWQIRRRQRHRAHQSHHHHQHHHHNPTNTTNPPKPSHGTPQPFNLQQRHSWHHRFDSRRNLASTST
jgi:hypothetical protein